MERDWAAAVLERAMAPPCAQAPAEEGGQLKPQAAAIRQWPMSVLVGYHLQVQLCQFCCILFKNSNPITPAI